MSTAAAPIRTLMELRESDIDQLARILVDCVEGGASVSFMAPLSMARARSFWEGVASEVARRERMVFVADDVEGIAGTVQLVLDQPENQLHRADIAKMLVHRRARGRGLGAALMAEAETAARAAGKTLLVLDTASDTAARLYQRAGWKLCGTIPGFALLPDGVPCDTHYYYRQLAESA